MTDKIEIPEVCEYCGGKVALCQASVLFGDRAKGTQIYACLNCNAHVSVRKGSKLPLGTLAKPALSLERRNTHIVFDHFCKRHSMSRKEGYRWLARAMGISLSNTHIGMFGFKDCRKAVMLCEKFSDGKEAA